MGKYLKWLFTRWYLYVLTLAWFLYYYKASEFFMWESFFGELLGTLILWCLVIFIIVGIKKLYLQIRKTKISS